MPEWLMTPIEPISWPVERRVMKLLSVPDINANWPASPCAGPGARFTRSRQLQLMR